MEEMDAGLAEIWKAVEKKGLGDNTIFIFTSDNGAWTNYPKRMERDGNTSKYHVGSNGIFRGAKRETYEGGVRVPYIMYWKYLTLKGEKITQFFSCLDLLPTFAEWTQSKLPLNLDGEAIGSLLTKKSFILNHRPVYYLNSSTAEVVRDGQWKLRRTMSDGKELIELYNLSWDPSERANLADKFPEKLKQLSELLISYPGH
jgi:arylsulfatase A